jgi:hypothetical protein
MATALSMDYRNSAERDPKKPRRFAESGRDSQDISGHFSPAATARSAIALVHTSRG